jgi:hypothetical protein
MKKLSQAEISSLLARSAARHSSGGQEEQAGMSLDRYYILQANASQADYDAGLISGEAFRARVATLKAEYRALKSR